MTNVNEKQIREKYNLKDNVVVLSKTVDKINTVEDVLKILKCEGIDYIINDDEKDKGEWLQIPHTSIDDKIACMSYQLHLMLNGKTVYITNMQDTWTKHKIKYVRIKIYTN